jgi:hypothetical protein
MKNSGPERRCPRCGHPPKQEFANRGGQLVELPFDRQVCMSSDCGLPCRLWDEWQSHAEAIKTPKTMQ